MTVHKQEAENPHSMPELLVSSSWLQHHLGDDDLVVLDCTAYLDSSAMPRAELEFTQSHIPGARFVHIETELSDFTHPVRFMAPTAEQLSKTLLRLHIGANTRVVLYSRSEVWMATRAWWVLRLYGFDRASVLDGGWKLWLAEGRPTASGAPLPHAGNHQANQVKWQPYTPQQRPGMLAHKADVLKSLAGKNAIVLNARLPQFFRGDSGNVYGRPGRISASVNVAAASHIGEDDKFLPPSELRAQFDAVLPTGAAVIAYCGYGIAASGTIFALALQGRQDAALYDGSLTEWAADHSLPMETGEPITTNL